MSNFLDKTTETLEKKLMPLAMKIGKQRHLMAVRDGVVASLPLTIVGGLMLVLASPPVDPATMQPTNIFFRFLLAWYSFADKFQDQLLVPFNMTMGVMALFIVMGIAYSLSRSYKMASFPSAVTAGVVYLITSAPMESGVLLRNIAGNEAALADVAESLIPTGFLGGTGMLTAILVGLLTVEISRFCIKHKATINLPDSVPPAIADSFTSLIPFTVNLLLFFGVQWVLSATMGVNLGEFIFSLLTPVIQAADSLVFLCAMIFVGQLGWFFGIHDTATMWPIFNPLSAMNLMENATQHLNNLPLDRVFTESFWASFMAIGGSGSTMALLILLLFSSVKHFKSIGRASLIPSIFNINEPIIFGLPVFLNPILGIPFIFVPVINTAIAFTATKLGLVGHSFLLPPWTTPSPICAFLSTMDWRAPLLVVILIALDVVLYLPFFKVYEKQMLQGEKAAKQTE